MDLGEDGTRHFGRAVYDVYMTSQQSCLGGSYMYNMKFRGEISAGDREHIPFMWQLESQGWKRLRKGRGGIAFRRGCNTIERVGRGGIVMSKGEKEQSD